MSLLGVLGIAVLRLISPDPASCQSSLEPGDLIISSALGKGEQGVWLDLLGLAEVTPDGAQRTPTENRITIVFLVESSSRLIAGGSSARQARDPASGCDMPWLERLTHWWGLAEDPMRLNVLTREIKVDAGWNGRERTLSIEGETFNPTLAEEELFVVVLDENWKSTVYQSDMTLESAPITKGSKEKILKILAVVVE